MKKVKGKVIVVGTDIKIFSFIELFFKRWSSNRKNSSSSDVRHKWTKFCKRLYYGFKFIFVPLLKFCKRPKAQKFRPKLFLSKTKIRMLSYSFSISGVRSYIVASYQSWYSYFLFFKKKTLILGQRRKFNYAGIRQHQPGKLPKLRWMVWNHQKGKPKQSFTWYEYSK